MSRNSLSTSFPCTNGNLKCLFSYVGNQSYNNCLPKCSRKYKPELSDQLHFVIIESRLKALIYMTIKSQTIFILWKKSCSHLFLLLCRSETFVASGRSIFLKPETLFLVENLLRMLYIKCRWCTIELKVC